MLETLVTLEATLLSLLGDGLFNFEKNIIAALLYLQKIFLLLVAFFDRQIKFTVMQHMGETSNPIEVTVSIIAGMYC
jgi:hypothetical protein